MDLNKLAVKLLPNLWIFKTVRNEIEGEFKLCGFCELSTYLLCSICDVDPMERSAVKLNVGRCKIDVRLSICCWRN